MPTADASTPAAALAPIAPDRKSAACAVQDATSAPRVCPVALCTGVPPADAPCCSRCFAKLPSLAQATWLQLRRAVRAEKFAAGIVRHARSRMQRFRLAALARLEAESQPLNSRHLLRAEELAPLLTPFPSFRALLHAADGYVPLLSCDTVRGQKRELRDRFVALANYYDSAQAERGDPRRAVRLGWGGL